MSVLNLTFHRQTIKETETLKMIVKNNGFLSTLLMCFG